MTRVRLTTIEHGLALLVAYVVATLIQIAAAVAVSAAHHASRAQIAWCLCDALPVSVALAVLAAGRVNLPRALIAAMLIELGSVASLVGLGASDAHVNGTATTARSLAVDAVAGVYGTPLGLIAALTGRATATFLAARAKGSLVEGAALGVPLAVGWSAIHAFAGPIFELGELAGPLTFGAACSVLVPAAERGVALAFARLGITSDEEASSADP